MTREGLRDDLDWQQRQLTAGIVAQCKGKKVQVQQVIKLWAKEHPLFIARWEEMLDNLRASAALDYTMFFVAIRELADLTQTTLQVSKEQ